MKNNFNKDPGFVYELVMKRDTSRFVRTEEVLDLIDTIRSAKIYHKNHIGKDITSAEISKYWKEKTNTTDSPGSLLLKMFKKEPELILHLIDIYVDKKTIGVEIIMTKPPSRKKPKPGEVIGKAKPIDSYKPEELSDYYKLGKGKHLAMRNSYLSYANNLERLRISKPNIR